MSADNGPTFGPLQDWYEQSKARSVLLERVVGLGLRIPDDHIDPLANCLRSGHVLLIQQIPTPPDAPDPTALSFYINTLPLPKQ